MRLSDLIDSLSALMALIGDIELVDKSVDTGRKPFNDIKALKTEIEEGPLADSLAKYWNDVFTKDPARPKLDFRVGRLKSDAAHMIHKTLLDPAKGDGIRSRADILGWGTGWTSRLVILAKQPSADKQVKP